MRFKSTILIMVLLLGIDSFSFAANNETRTIDPRIASPDVFQIQIENRVHRRGNVWMNISNWGRIGNDSPGRQTTMDDPEFPGEWAPQCEFPAGSGAQYLFKGALWVGALVQAEGYEYPRVSVGADGWALVDEMWPGEGEQNGIVERSSVPGSVNYLGEQIYSPDAVAPQEFIATYSDTLTEDFWVDEDPIDGPHEPLGIKITQKSMAWDANGLEDFIIIEWEIENISDNYLKNLYVGLYVDSDVGHKDNRERYTDDLCGFQKYYYYENPEGGYDSLEINTAWIADNDGRPVGVGSGTDFSAPGISGVRVLDAPNPNLRTSFNWWMSNSNWDLDFGPSWMDDGAPGEWTSLQGTPMGDAKKYFLLSNREFDYDQVFVNDADYISDHPQIFRDPISGDINETHNWKIPGVDDETPNNYVDDLANGYDSRYMISWGPMGIFDHIDESGNRIYSLNPGENFSMTVAYVCGEAFHDRNNPQPSDEYIDPARFNYYDLRNNSLQAKHLFDNDYQTPHPFTPINLRAIQGFTSIWLSWQPAEILPGTIINIYRKTENDDWSDIPINSEPIVGNSFADSSAQLGEQYIYMARAVRYDTLFSGYSEEVFLHVGAPSTPTGVQAVGGDGFIELTWDENPDTDIDFYNIYRVEIEGNLRSIYTTREETYRDIDVTNAIEYTYTISAVDNHGIEGKYSDAVDATPMGFNLEMLVVFEVPNRIFPIDWQPDSIFAFYERLFLDIEEEPDQLTVNNEQFPSLGYLSSYRIMWIIHDNIGPYFELQGIKNNIISNYLSLGGKVIISGRNIFNESFGYPGVLRSADDLFHDYFQIDSVRVTNPPSILSDFIAANSIIEGYPNIRVDSTKALQLWRNDNIALSGVDGLIPTDEGEVLYRFNSVNSDSSDFENLAVGVKHVDANSAAAILTFPLYGMQPYESVKSLAIKLLEDVRAVEESFGEFSNSEKSESINILGIHPNPFNDKTLVKFETQSGIDVEINIFDISGRLVSNLSNQFYPAGSHTVVVSKMNLVTGLYIVHISGGSHSDSRKLILIK